MTILEAVKKVVATILAPAEQGEIFHLREASKFGPKAESESDLIFRFDHLISANHAHRSRRQGRPLGAS
jgi:hypothetical protein